MTPPATPVPPRTVLRCALLALALGALGAGTLQPNPPAAAPALGSAKTPPPPSADWAARAKAFGGHEWVTRPSRDSIMGFAAPTEVGEILVTDGQKVAKGQLLIKARDADALAALEVQRVRAANEAPIEAAKAQLELAQIRFDAIMDADARKAASPADVAERRLSLAAAKQNKLNAESSYREENARLTQLQRQVERLSLLAPFDGVVDAVGVEVGQAVDVNRPVLRLVAIDPMWADVPTPTEVTLERKLKADSRAWVLLDMPGEPRIVEAKVLTVSPVADPAAGTRRVRIEIPNADGVPPGVRVRVRFTEPPRDWWKSAPSPTASAEPAPPAESARASSGGGGQR